MFQLITDDEVAAYEQLCRDDPKGLDRKLMEVDFTLRRRWWREVGEYVGTRHPVGTVTSNREV